MTDPLPVLVAEDDKNDVFLLKRALRQAGVSNPLYLAEDGQEAIDYLSGTGPFADRERFPMPGLIILDIKMPKKTGLEVLKWVREKSAVQDIPVVITSSSKLEVDINEALGLGATAYFVKPLAIADLLPYLQREGV